MKARSWHFPRGVLSHKRLRTTSLSYSTLLFEVKAAQTFHYFRKLSQSQQSLRKLPLLLPLEIEMKVKIQASAEMKISLCCEILGMDD